MNVQGKYLKDENDNIISPVVNTDSIYDYQSRNLSNVIAKYELAGSGIDTGYKSIEPEENFLVYPDESYPSIRRIGNFVYIKGVVTPATDFEAETAYNILLLPNKNKYDINFYPDSEQYFVCQGSRRYHWLLTITTSGIVRFSRYGRTDYDPCTSGTWLPFNVIYPVFG